MLDGVLRELAEPPVGLARHARCRETSLSVHIVGNVKVARFHHISSTCDGLDIKKNACIANAFGSNIARLEVLGYPVALEVTCHPPGGTPGEDNVSERAETVRCDHVVDLRLEIPVPPIVDGSRCVIPDLWLYPLTRHGSAVTVFDVRNREIRESGDVRVAGQVARATFVPGRGDAWWVVPRCPEGGLGAHRTVRGTMLPRRWVAPSTPFEE
mmetsp:Transcript_20237/g.52500  ORF Transcript_20237/g.52500 Transcript_20237/m.52500 type:complete len:212 (-) Transcript_20237:252-887(-)